MSKVAEIEHDQNEPNVDTKEAVKCPKCGSHTLRAFSPEGTNVTIVCLTCGNEFSKKVHINPEAAAKEAAGILDPNLHAQIVGLTQQIQQAYSSGNVQLAQQLNQQLQQLLDNPNQPLTQQPQQVQPMHANVEVLADGVEVLNEYKQDYKAGDRVETPFGYGTVTSDLGGGWHVNFDDGSSDGLSPDEMRLVVNSKTKTKVDNNTLADTTDKFFLESTVFEADSIYDGGDDPYVDQNVDLNQYQQEDPADMDDRNLDYAHCTACDGPGVLLGQLGNRIHYRCRNCGLDFSHKVDEGNSDPNAGGPVDRDVPFGEGLGSSDPTYYASLEDVKEVNKNTLKSLNDSSGNPLVAGKYYTMNHPTYKVPDVVKILNLEDNRIEAAIESDEHGSFPIHITSDDAYTLSPYEKTASNWKISRKNFSADEQDELVNENPKGKARNFDKLKLDGTHYQVKEEATDPNFLLGW